MQLITARQEVVSYCYKVVKQLLINKMQEVASVIVQVMLFHTHTHTHRVILQTNSGLKVWLSAPPNSSLTSRCFPPLLVSCLDPKRPSEGPAVSP